MVLNDEGHHCYRPAPPAERLTGGRGEGGRGGHRRKRRSGSQASTGSTPAAGSGSASTSRPRRSTSRAAATPRGQPFPWLVSDFGLVDAIESGIVKIPRLPVSDTTGRPDRSTSASGRNITDELQPADRLAGQGGKPKPESSTARPKGAEQLASQWVERFELHPGGDAPTRTSTPPVLIIVCDNTDIAEVFYRNISGEDDVEARGRRSRRTRKTTVRTTTRRPPRRRRAKKTKTARHLRASGQVFSGLLRQHRRTPRRTVRIDRNCSREAESDDPNANRQGRGRGVAADRGHGRAARRAGRAGPVRRLGRDAHRGMGREQRDPHPRPAGLPQPVALRAGRRPRPAADGLHARPGRPAC